MLTEAPPVSYEFHLGLSGGLSQRWYIIVGEVIFLHLNLFWERRLVTVSRPVSPQAPSMDADEMMVDDASGTPVEARPAANSIEYAVKSALDAEPQIMPYLSNLLQDIIREDCPLRLRIGFTDFCGLAGRPGCLKSQSALKSLVAFTPTTSDGWGQLVAQLWGESYILGFMCFCLNCRCRGAVGAYPPAFRRRRGAR
jgi:hypothetical protein